MAARKPFDILRDKSRYKSIAFTRKERLRLGLQGLLPHVVATQAQLVDRAMSGLRALPRDIDRYMALSSMQERNERLFYKTLITNIEETLPWIYTPTVGQACTEFSHIAREPKGFYITPDDRGRIAKILGNWREKDIRVIVVTDGQRILGLGDLGANGTGIPIGKLALYTACAGIPPRHCLPVMLDVGTNNSALLEDEFYIGYPRRRLSGAAYFALVDEFVHAVQKRYPGALIQFEDFQTPDAYALLNKYRDRVLCFNDDIQGTAAVALAGVSAATRIIQRPLRDLRIMDQTSGKPNAGLPGAAFPSGVMWTTLPRCVSRCCACKGIGSPVERSPTDTNRLPSFGSIAMRAPDWLVARLVKGCVCRMVFTFVSVPASSSRTALATARPQFSASMLRM